MKYQITGRVFHSSQSCFPKYLNMLGIFYQNLLSTCFYIIWVCWIRIFRMTLSILCSSPSNKQKKKNGRQNINKNPFFDGLSHRNAQFMVSVSFGIDKFIYVVFWMLRPIFDPKIQDGRRFLHICNYSNCVFRNTKQIKALQNLVLYEPQKRELIIK